MRPRSETEERLAGHWEPLVCVSGVALTIWLAVVAYVIPRARPMVKTLIGLPLILNQNSHYPLEAQKWTLQFPLKQNKTA